MENNRLIKAIYYAVVPTLLAIFSGFIVSFASGLLWGTATALNTTGGSVVVGLFIGWRILQSPTYPYKAPVNVLLPIVTTLGGICGHNLYVMLFS